MTPCFHVRYKHVYVIYAQVIKKIAIKPNMRETNGPLFVDKKIKIVNKANTTNCHLTFSTNTIDDNHKNRYGNT